MNTVRFTCRMPKDLLTKVKVLAVEKNNSVNKEIAELVALGIESFITKTKEAEEKLNKR